MSYFAVTSPKNATDVPIAVLDVFANKEEAKQAVKARSTRFGDEALSIYRMDHVYTFHNEELTAIRQSLLKAKAHSSENDPMAMSDILRRAQADGRPAPDAYVVRHSAHRS